MACYDIYYSFLKSEYIIMNYYYERVFALFENDMQRNMQKNVVTVFKILDAWFSVLVG